MAVQQPTGTNVLNAPSHSKAHKIWAWDNSAPDKSAVIRSDGQAAFKYGPIVSPRHPDFGALGDGTTSDGTAIQNAINSLGTRGGIINLEDGLFRIDDALLMKSEINFKGLGMESTIIKNHGTTHAFKYTAANSVKHSVLSNMKIEDAGSGLDLINLNTATQNNIFEKLWLSNAGRHGIYGTYSFSDVFDSLQIEDCTSKGIYLDATCNNDRIVNSNITRCDIGIEVHNLSSGVTISGCAVESCGTGSILIYGGGWNHNIRDCYLEYGTSYGIKLDAASGNGPNTVHIENNFFYSAMPGNHIDAERARDINIKNNVFGDASSTRTHIRLGTNARCVGLESNTHWGSGTNEDFDPSATYWQLKKDTTNQWLEAKNIYFDKDKPNKMEPYSQAGEPTLALRQFAFWWDTGNSKLYWVYNMDGVQKKIELT